MIDPTISNSGWTNYNVDWAEQACCGSDRMDYPYVGAIFYPGIPSGSTVLSLDINSSGFSYSWQATAGSPTCTNSGTYWEGQTGGQDLQSIKYVFYFKVNLSMVWNRNGIIQTCTGAGSGDVYATVDYTSENVSTPSTPTGPSNGFPTSAEASHSYTFSTGGSSSDWSNPVQYQIFWVAGSNSGWLTPAPLHQHGERQSRVGDDGQLLRDGPGADFQQPGDVFCIEQCGHDDLYAHDDDRDFA